jgi:hypothetical protein
VAVGGSFALYVRSRIIESGDAAVTADNIRVSATLFRVGFVSDLVAATCFLLTAMALYLLLRHVHQLVAAAMVTFVAVGTAIACLSLLNQYTALTIATGDDYTRTFGKAGSDALTMLFADMQSVAGMFFGLWLLPLGYLVIKSGYFPKMLGVLLIIGCFGYLADLFVGFLAPDVEASIGLFFAGIGGLSEVLFIAWLLVKAVRVPAREAPVPATAHQLQP